MADALLRLDRRIAIPLKAVPDNGRGCKACVGFVPEKEQCLLAGRQFNGNCWSGKLTGNTGGHIYELA
jgi:hypothetical protein